MIERLTATNPWWVAPEAIRDDPLLVRRNQAPVRWSLRVVPDIDLSRPSIYTIRGPRQVGKTTAIKLMIARSLDSARQEQVLYYSFDLESDPEAIIQVVQEARRLRPRGRRWRIFLDEVSNIPNWQRAVKWLRDNTPAAGDTFVVTGSSALDLEAGTERLPGRRGPGTALDRILLPLSFSDFARIHGVEPMAEWRMADFFGKDAADRLMEARIYYVWPGIHSGLSSLS